MRTFLFALAFLSPGCASMPHTLHVECKTLVWSCCVDYTTEGEVCE
jgi:hypothetical protein